MHAFLSSAIEMLIVATPRPPALATAKKSAYAPHPPLADTALAAKPLLASCQAAWSDFTRERPQQLSLAARIEWPLPSAERRIPSPRPARPPGGGRRCPPRYDHGRLQVEATPAS